MKKIPLYKGKGKNSKKCGLFALVDDEDFEYLNQWKWHQKKAPCGVSYAIRWERHEGKTTNYPMHREINKTPVGKITDHRDGDGFNNQKWNLRSCSWAQNAHNMKHSRHAGSSKYKGVSIKKTPHGGKTYYYWRAQIRSNNKKIQLGDFPLTAKGEKDAAQCYIDAQRKYHSEMAWIKEVCDYV